MCRGWLTQCSCSAVWAFSAVFQLQGHNRRTKSGQTLHKTEIQAQVGTGKDHAWAQHPTVAARLLLQPLIPAQCGAWKFSGNLFWVPFFIALALHTVDVRIHTEIDSLHRILHSLWPWSFGTSHGLRLVMPDCSPPLTKQEVKRQHIIRNNLKWLCWNGHWNN